MPRFSTVHWIPKLLVSLFWAHAALQVDDIHGTHRKPLELQNQKAAIFIFVGIDCPISNGYAPEINQIVADNKDKELNFYLVYSDPTLSSDDAKKHAADFGYTCPELLDHDQLLMKKLDAKVTPEAVVVDPHGAVLYRGRIDNKYEDFGKKRYTATKHELRDALDAIVAGKKVAVPVTQAVGCPI